MWNVSCCFVKKGGDGHPNLLGERSRSPEGCTRDWLPWGESGALQSGVEGAVRPRSFSTF